MCCAIDEIYKAEVVDNVVHFMRRIDGPFSIDGKPLFAWIPTCNLPLDAALHLFKKLARQRKAHFVDPSVA